MDDFTADPNRGIPLDTFLEQHRTSPIKKYSIDQVRSATKLLLPNYLRIAPDSTLEAIISIVYYPELMGLLVNEMSAVACSFHILENHSNPLFFKRSYGYLLVQILGLATEIGLLAQNNQLAPFIRSVSGSSRPDGTEVWYLLKEWSMRYINQNIQNSGGRLLTFKSLVGWKSPPEVPDPICLTNVGGHGIHSTMNMIVSMYLGRDTIFKAQTCIPALGYAEILCIMWAHLHYTPPEILPPHLWEMYGELMLRYFLVASPSEHPILETLVEEFIRADKAALSKSANKADAEVIVATVIRQLSLRHDKGVPIKLGYTKQLTDVAYKAAEGSKLFDLHVPVFTAAFNRLWYEIIRASQHNEGESWKRILLYATLLIDPVVLYVGRDGTTHYMKTESWPRMLSLFLEIDLMNLAARLVLAPAVAEISITNPDLTLSQEILISLNILSDRLLQFPKLVASTFKSQAFDWAKTFGYIRQLENMSLPPTHPLQPHLEERTMTWVRLGSTLGCLERPKPQLCTYSRCAGAETSFLEHNLRGAFCSMRCQQADRERKENLYGLVCPPESDP